MLQAGRVEGRKEGGTRSDLSAAILVTVPYVWTLSLVCHAEAGSRIQV